MFFNQKMSRKLYILCVLFLILHQNTHPMSSLKTMTKIDVPYLACGVAWGVACGLAYKKLINCYTYVKQQRDPANFINKETTGAAALQDLSEIGIDVPEMLKRTDNNPDKFLFRVITINRKNRFVPNNCSVVAITPPNSFYQYFQRQPAGITVVRELQEPCGKWRYLQKIHDYMCGFEYQKTDSETQKQITTHIIGHELGHVTCSNVCIQSLEHSLRSSHRIFKINILSKIALELRRYAEKLADAYSATHFPETIPGGIRLLEDLINKGKLRYEQGDQRFDKDGNYLIDIEHPKLTDRAAYLKKILDQRNRSQEHRSDL